MATKSLIIRTEVDTAGKAHNCQASAKHRIERGDVRLKVRNGRSWDHYCLACAQKIIGIDIAKLLQLQEMKPLTSGAPSP
jgi:hypothetical protein